MKVLFALLPLMLAACAPSATVVVSPGYDPARVQLVTIGAIADFPDAPGSGEAVAAVLEKRLLVAGDRLVTRRRALPALRAALGDAAADADADQIRAAARDLGVDGMIFGTLADYTPASERTIIADYPQREFAPIYGSASRTAGREDPFPAGDDQTSWVKVPVEQITPARIALTIELLDADTGETLWTATAERSGNDLAVATAEAVDALVEAVSKKRRSAAARSTAAASTPAPPDVPGPPSAPPIPAP